MSTSTFPAGRDPDLPAECYQLPFWPRQFDDQPTRGQYAFDMIFGVFMPLVCLYLDPIVLRSDFGPPFLRGCSLAVYSLMAVCMLALMTWLIFRWPAAMLSGFLTGGALFAACLGVLLFPFSLIGLWGGIGVFGFTPLATTFVYGRNALRAYQQNRQIGKPVSTWLLAVAALVMCLILPLVAQVTGIRMTEKAMADVLSADTDRNQNGLAVLKRFHYLTGLDPIVRRFESSQDPDEQKRLANVYYELTGNSIEYQLKRRID